MTPCCAEYTCKVRYDEKREVYRYEYHGTLRATQDVALGTVTFFDPLPYNIREPGSEVVYRWNAAGYRWFVYQAPDNRWMRIPIVDYRPDAYQSAYSNPRLKWGKATDLLYPDPAACPVFESELGWEQRFRRFLGVVGAPYRCYCVPVTTWGFLFPHAETDEGTGSLEFPPTLLAKDGERQFGWTFTAYPPAEADTIMAQSRLPEGLAKETRKPIPFVAAGNTFAPTNTWENPGGTTQWRAEVVEDQAYGKHGAMLDETEGHGDKGSMLILGPGGATVRFYQHVFDDHAKRYWVRGWFKAKGTGDSTLKLDIAYPFSKDAREVYVLGGGDLDWTYFSLVTTVPRVKDRTDMGFFLDKGKVWLDDVAITGLRDDENPATTTTTPMDLNAKK